MGKLTANIDVENPWRKPARGNDLQTVGCPSETGSHQPVGLLPWKPTELSSKPWVSLYVYIYIYTYIICIYIYIYYVYIYIIHILLLPRTGGQGATNTVSQPHES